MIDFCTDSDMCMAHNYTNADDEYGLTWMYFPDGDNDPQMVYLTEPLNQTDIRYRPKRPKKEHVTF